MYSRAADYNIFLNKKIKTPGDGFEPPLEDPESSVLPLDDPGIYKIIL